MTPGVFLVEEDAGASDPLQVLCDQPFELQLDLIAHGDLVAKHVDELIAVHPERLVVTLQRTIEVAGMLSWRKYSSR